MGPIPRSKERIVVKIQFESRPVLMSKYHDSLLFMALNREALDRLSSFEHVSSSKFLIDFYSDGASECTGHI